MDTTNPPLRKAIDECSVSYPSINIQPGQWKDKISLSDNETPLQQCLGIFILPIDNHNEKFLSFQDGLRMIKRYFPRDHSIYDFSRFSIYDKEISLVYNILGAPPSNSFYTKPIYHAEQPIFIHVYCVCKVGDYEGTVYEMKQSTPTNNFVDPHRKERTDLLHTIVSITLPFTYKNYYTYNPFVLLGRVTLEIAKATNAYNTMQTVFKILTAFFFLLPMAITTLIVYKKTRKSFPFPFHHK